MEEGEIERGGWRENGEKGGGGLESRIWGCERKR